MEDEKTRKPEIDIWTLEDGLKYLKKLREMPYDTSKVGQVFVIIPFRRLPKKQEQEKIQKKINATKYSSKSGIPFYYSKIYNLIIQTSSG